MHFEAIIITSYGSTPRRKAELKLSLTNGQSRFITINVADAEKCIKADKLAVQSEHILPNMVSKYYY